MFILSCSAGSKKRRHCRWSFGLLLTDLAVTKASEVSELLFAEYFIRVVTWETTSALQWVASVWDCLAVAQTQWSWFCFPFMIVSICRGAAGSSFFVLYICSSACPCVFVCLYICERMFSLESVGENWLGVAVRIYPTQVGVGYLIVSYDYEFICLIDIQKIDSNYIYNCCNTTVSHFVTIEAF